MQQFCWRSGCCYGNARSEEFVLVRTPWTKDRKKLLIFQINKTYILHTSSIWVDSVKLNRNMLALSQQISFWCWNQEFLYDRIGSCVVYAIAALILLYWDKTDKLGIMLGLLMMGMVTLFLIVVSYMGIDWIKWVKDMITLIE